MLRIYNICYEVGAGADKGNTTLAIMHVNIIIEKSGRNIADHRGKEDK